MKGKLTISCDIICLHTCKKTHIGCAHDTCEVKVGRVASIDGCIQKQLRSEGRLSADSKLAKEFSNICMKV